MYEKKENNEGNLPVIVTYWWGEFTIPLELVVVFPGVGGFGVAVPWSEGVPGVGGPALETWRIYQKMGKVAS